MFLSLLRSPKAAAQDNLTEAQQGPALEEVEISPRVYRSGPLTATFTHKGGFAVKKGGTVIAGAPDFRDHEGVLISIIDDEMEDLEVREAATIILGTTRRSMYGGYVVVSEEEDEEEGSGNDASGDGKGRT